MSSLSHTELLRKTHALHVLTQKRQHLHTEQALILEVESVRSKALGHGAAVIET